MAELQILLRKLKACEEAVEWVGERDLPTAWTECCRADWMLWLCEEMTDKEGWPNHKQVLLTAIECGRLSLAYAGQYKTQLAEIFDIAERCANNPTAKNISAAEDAAESAWSAAKSAGRAAESAWSAACAAGSAAENAAESAGSTAKSVAWSVAGSTAESAKSATGNTAWSAAHKKMCDIIRQRLGSMGGAQ